MKNSFILPSLLLCSLMIAQEQAPQKETANQQQTSQQENIYQNITTYARSWVSEYVGPLSSVEHALMANYLYFQYLACFHESNLRSALLALQSQMIQMNKCMVDNNPPMKDVVLTTATLLCKAKEQFPLCAQANQLLQACGKEIDQTGFNTLKQLIGGLMNYRRNIITSFLKRDKESVENVIRISQESFTTHLPKLNFCNNTLLAIINNENPYFKEGDNKEMTDMDITITCADTALQSMQELENATNNMRHMTVDLLNINASLFSTFYQTLYTALAQSNKVPHIMFDANGLLAPENRRDWLPSLEMNN
jgi:hypothetical protein